MNNEKSVDNFESALYNAADGDKESITLFFKELLKTTLYVPKRHQSSKLSNQADYPNELVHIMGIKTKAGSVVPAFSRIENIEEWSGTNFEYFSLNVVELCKKVPESWSVIINPGLGAEKELSPFEIKELTLGEDALDALIAENLNQEKENNPVKVLAYNLEDKESFLKKIKNFGDAKKEIINIYSLKEISDIDNEEKQLIGIELSSNAKDEEEIIKDEFLKAVGEDLIGDIETKVFAFKEDTSSMHSGLLKQGSIIFKKENPGLFKRIIEKLS